MSSFPPPGDGSDGRDGRDRSATPPGDSGPVSPPPPGQQSGPGGWQTGQPSGPPAGQPRSDAAARPTVPLRPLGLGDMFDGAFRTIRQNVRATVGFAFAVNLVFLAVPVLGLVVLSGLGELGPIIPELQTTGGGGETIGLGTLVSGVLSALSGGLAGIVVTGLVVQVVARAAIGEKLTAGEAWRRTRPRLLQLVGLSLLSGLLPALVLLVVVLAGFGVGVAAGTGPGVAVGILLGVLGVLFTVWFWTRYLLLAPCVLVLEGSGVFASMRRARTLSTGSFWRLLGVYVLIAIAAYIAASLVSIPLALGGVATIFLAGDTTLGTVIYLMINNLSTVITGALSAPFVGAVVALQYLDVRIRREGLDVRLRQQAARRAADGPGLAGDAR